MNTAGAEIARQYPLHRRKWVRTKITKARRRERKWARSAFYPLQAQRLPRRGALVIFVQKKPGQ